MSTKNSESHWMALVLPSFKKQSTLSRWIVFLCLSTSLSLLNSAVVADNTTLLGSVCKKENRASTEKGVKIACLPKRGELVWQKAEWQDVSIEVLLRNVPIESTSNFNVSAASSRCLSEVRFGEETSKWSNLLISATLNDVTRLLVSKQISNPIVSLSSQINYGGTRGSPGLRSMKCTWREKVRIVDIFKDDNYVLSFSGLNAKLSYEKLKSQKWNIRISRRSEPLNP